MYTLVYVLTHITTYILAYLWILTHVHTCCVPVGRHWCCMQVHAICFHLHASCLFVSLHRPLFHAFVCMCLCVQRTKLNKTAVGTWIPSGGAPPPPQSASKNQLLPRLHVRLCENCLDPRQFTCCAFLLRFIFSISHTEWSVLPDR